jgi:HEAT repeat protein
MQIPGSTPAAAPGPVHLEGPGTMFVLFRIENKAIDQIRTFTPDCELDAGGLPFHWLTGVRPADSIAFLSATALERANESDRSGKDRIGERAVSAIALHGDPVADQALENLVAPDKPESIRERTTFWLGSSRGARGAEILKRLVAQDPSDRVREKAIFGLSASKEPTAVNIMIDAAKNDKSAHVRGQALFWLAQKAGRRETQAITDAIANDPDTQVKKKAVFALEQLPNHEGVPLLIQVARTNKNPEVRKQAMFWLGQSKDPRAVSFFEEVLTK